MSPSLKSAQPGSAPSAKRASPAGGAKKNTSWRVGKMRGPNNLGKTFGSQGPQAKTCCPALTVAPSETVDGLEVVLIDRVTELSGRLLDQAGRPAPELFVIAFPANPALWHERSRWMREPVHPASDGRFAFTGLPAGDYYLAVLPTLESDWRDPAYLEQVVPGALRLTLGVGEQRTQDIRLAQ